MISLATLDDARAGRRAARPPWNARDRRCCRRKRRAGSVAKFGNEDGPDVAAATEDELIKTSANWRRALLAALASLGRNTAWGFRRKATLRTRPKRSSSVPKKTRASSSVFERGLAPGGRRGFTCISLMWAPKHLEETNECWWYPNAQGQRAPTQPVTQHGPGAVVDLPELSVIVAGINHWRPTAEDVVPVRLQNFLQVEPLPSSTAGTGKIWWPPDVCLSGIPRAPTLVVDTRITASSIAQPAGTMPNTVPCEETPWQGKAHCVPSPLHGRLSQRTP